MAVVATLLAFAAALAFLRRFVARHPVWGLPLVAVLASFGLSTTLALLDRLPAW